ncbi:unnamed protein product [Cylindrotheca closterium]|uniref:Uncharacterized protein n=1 Tax=Cylindrotheca closterium TaxID=2856 RepID=A0AAD2CF02_9STRA|nr:unnamed protein product [Cylindrotheca closterium]
MFERLVSKALGDFLSKYFTEESLAKNGASTSAQLGVWSGYITLSNIELKKDVINEKLQKKGQPFEIVQCNIRKVEITIPWAQMSNPIQSTDRSRDEGVVVVVLDGITLLVKTKFDFDDVALRVGEVENRRKKLMKSTYSFNGESNSSKTSFTDSVKQRITSGLLQQIMDKLHIHIRDLHVRIEDVESDPANPYAFGVSMESMHLHHNEVSGTGGDVVKKVVQLNHFAAYWNVCDYIPDLPEENSLFHQISDEAQIVAQKLHSTISRRASLIASPSRRVHAPNHTYILLPVDGMMYLDLSTTPNDLTRRPALSATIVIDEVSTQLRDFQCVQILRLYREIKNHQFVKKYRRFRPLVSVKEDSRAWWHYAARVIRYQLKENFMRWSRTRFGEGFKARQRYMMLYEKKVLHPNGKLEEKAAILSLNNHPIALLKAQKSFESSIEEGNDSTTLTSDAKSSVPLQLQEQDAVKLEEFVELQALEDGKIGDLSVGDIILFRAIVNMRGGRPINNNSQNGGNEVKNEGSWWSSSLAKVADDSDTRKEFDRLLELLNEDKQKTAAPLLRNRLQTAVDFSLRLQEVSASVFAPSHLTKDERPLRRLHNKFLEFKSLHVHTKTALKGDYKTIDYHLSVMDVLGLEIGANIGDFVISSQATRVDPGNSIGDPEQATEDSPFLQVAITKHPPAPSACDLEVIVFVNSMEVYLTPNSKWIRNLQAIAKQLSGLPKVADFWKDLSMAYVNSLALGNFGRRAKAEYGVEDHKSIDVDISIECPKIRISDGDGWDIFIDLGSASVKTAKLAGVSCSNLRNSSVVVENNETDSMMTMMRTMGGMDDSSAVGSEIGPSPMKYRFEVGTPNPKRTTSISSAISIGSRAKSRTGAAPYEDGFSFRYDGGDDNSVGCKSKTRDAGMQMNEIFYDVYVFRLQTGKITTKGVDPHELSPSFGISTTIKKSILPSDHTICKLKASTLIDHVTLNLNESSIMHFAKLLRIWKGITLVHSAKLGNSSLNHFPSRLGVLDDQIGNQISQSQIETDIWDDSASLSQVDEGEFFDADDGYDSMSNTSARWFDDNWITDTESVIDADSRSLRGGRSRRKRSISISETSSNSDGSFVGRKNVSGIYLSAENLANLNQGISEADESFGESEGSDDDSFHSVMSAGGQMKVLNELEEGIVRTERILNKPREATENGGSSDLGNHSAHSESQGMGAASKVEISRAVAELNILKALHADLSSMLDGIRPNQEVSSNEKVGAFEDRSQVTRIADHHARAVRAILDARHRRDSITRASNTHNLTRNLNRELFQGSVLVGKIEIILQLEEEAEQGTHLESQHSMIKLVAEDTAVALSKRRQDMKLYFSMDQMEVLSGYKNEETSFLLLSCGGPDTLLPSHFPHLVSRSMEDKFIRGAFHVTQHQKDSSSDRITKSKKLRLVLGDIEASPCEQHISPVLSFLSRRKKTGENVSKDERATPDHADKDTNDESSGKSIIPTTGSLADIALRLSSVRMVLRQKKRVVSAFAISELSARLVHMESHLKNKLQLDLQCTNVQILEVENLESGFGGELFGRRDAYTSLIQTRVRTELVPSHETGGWVLGMGKPKLRNESPSLNDIVRNVHIGVRLNPINIASSPTGVRGFVGSIGELEEATKKAYISPTKPSAKSKGADPKIPLRFRCDISLRRIAIAFHEAEQNWRNDGGSSMVVAFTVVASLQGSTLGRKSLSSQVALADITAIRTVDEWPIVEPFTVASDISLTTSPATSGIQEMDEIQLQIPNDSRLNEVKPYMDLFVWEKLPKEHLSEEEVRVSVKITPINANLSAPVISLLAGTKEKLQQVVAATKTATKTAKVNVKKVEPTPSAQSDSSTTPRLLSVSVEAIECIVLKEAESRPISSAKPLFSLQQKELQIEFSSNPSTAVSLSIREFSLIDFSSVHGIRVLGEDPTGRERNGSQNPFFLSVELFSYKQSDGPTAATLNIHWGRIQCLPVPSFVASLLTVSQVVKSTLQSRATLPDVKSKVPKENALSKLLGSPRDVKLTLKADAESFECILPSRDLVEYAKVASTDPIGVVSLRWKATLSMAIALDSLKYGSKPWLNLNLDGSLSDKKDNGLFKDFSDRYFSRSFGLDGSDEKAHRLVNAFTARIGLIVTNFQVLRTDIASTSLVVSSNGSKGASRLPKNRIAFKVCPPQAGEQRITNPIDLRLSYRAVGASMSGSCGGDDHSPSVEISQLLELEATKAVDFLLYISQGERGWTEAQKVTVRPILDLLKKKQARRKKEETTDSVPQKEAQPNSIKLLAMSATTLCSIRLPGFQVTCVPGGATNLNEAPIIKFELSSLSVGLAFLPVHKNVLGGLTVPKGAAGYGAQLVPEGKIDIMYLTAAGWIDCVMSAHYHNRRLVAWEPFVEPWTVNIRFGANLADVLKVPPILKRSFDESQRSDFDPWIVSKLNEGTTDRLRDVGRLFRAPFHSAASKSSNRISHNDLSYLMLASTARESILAAQYPTSESSDGKAASAFLLLPSQDAMGWLRGFGFPDTSRKGSRENPEHYSVSCVISDQKPLNVNLTGALIENVIGYMDNSKKSGFETIAPHWIRNESGLTIRFREVLESDRVKLGEEAGKTILLDGSRIPLTLKRSISQSCDPHRAYIYLELGSAEDFEDFDGRIDNGDIDDSPGSRLGSFLYKTAAKIPVDTVGVHRYPLDNNVEMVTETGVMITDTRSLGWIIVRVALQGGTKVISVESPFTIRSSADTDLLCELREKFSQSVLWRYLIPKVEDQRDNDEYSGFVSIPADIVPLVHDRAYSFKVVAFNRGPFPEIDLSSISDSAIRISVPPPFSDLSVRKGLLQEREVALPTIGAEPESSPDHFHLSVCSIRIGNLFGATSAMKVPEQRMLLFRSPLVIQNFLALPIALQIRVKYHDMSTNERSLDRSRSQGASGEQSLIRKETLYMEWQDIGVLDCGQSTNWTGALSKDRVQIRVRFVGLNGDNSRRFPGWSSPATIPTKDNYNQSLNKKKGAFDHLRVWDADEIPLDLSVALETGTHTTDSEMGNIRHFSEGFSSGTRVVSLFVPYWVVDSTSEDLEFSAGGPIAGQLDKHVSFDTSRPNVADKGMLGLAELMDNDGFVNLPSKSPFDVMMIGDSSATRLTIRKRVSRTSRRRRWRHPSPWSDPIPLQSGRNLHDTTVLSFIDQSKTHPEEQGQFDRYVLRSSMKPAPDTCGGSLGTLLIHVVNRYAIINEIGRDIEILQGREEGASLLVRASSKPQPFHFDVSKAIRFRFKEFGWDWSGKFHIQMNRREVTMRLRHKMKGEAVIVTVEVQTEKNSSTYSLVFRQSTNPPFRLENQTMHPLYFGQSAISRSSQEADADTMLLPYQSADFAWDEPELRRRAMLMKYRDPRNGRDSVLGRFFLDRSVPGSKPSVENPLFAMEVVADGPTRVLRLTDAAMPQMQQLSNGRSGEKNDFRQVQDADRAFTVSLVVRLSHGLGVSVVDWSPQELVYARLDDIQIERNIDLEKDTVTLAVGNIKMNNQLWVTPYPVLLKMGRRSDSNSSLRRNRKNDAISLSWRRPLTPTGGYGNVTILELVELSSQPLFANVDGNLVHLLLRMMKQVTGTTTGTNPPTILSRDDELKKILSVHRDSSPANVTEPKKGIIALFNQDADGELVTTAAIAAKLKSEPLPLVRIKPSATGRKKQKRQQFSSKTKRKFYIEKIKISAARADLSWSGPLPGRLSKLLLRALTFERLPLRLRPYSGSHAYGNAEDHVQALKSYYVSFWRILDLLMGLSYNPTFLSKAIVYTLRESLASSLEILSESYSYNAKSLSRLLPDKKSNPRYEDGQRIENVSQESLRLTKSLVSPIVQSVSFSLRCASAVTSWVSSMLKYGPQDSKRLASRGMSRSRTPRVFARVDGKELLVEYIEGGNSGKSLLSRVRMGIHLGEGYIIHTEEARLLQENRLTSVLDPNPLIFMVTSERAFLLNGTLDQAFCTVEWEATFLNLVDVELTAEKRISLREMIVWYLSDQDIRTVDEEDNAPTRNTSLPCIGMRALQNKHIFLPESIAEQVVEKLRKAVSGFHK